MKIILASQSPRRRELLARLGLPFSAQAPDIDETMEPGEDPAREVARVSRAKAMAVEAAPEDVVIAANRGNDHGAKGNYTLFHFPGNNWRWKT